MDAKKQVAYDYDAQRWISGPDAITLRRRQLMEDLELLRSSVGQRYAKFIGLEQGEAIRRVLVGLAELQN